MWPNFYIQNNPYLNLEKFEDELDFLLHLSDEQIVNDEIVLKIENIAKIFEDRIKVDGLSDIDDLYLESHAYEINNKINNNDIRNMPFSDYN